MPAIALLPGRGTARTAAVPEALIAAVLTILELIAVAALLPCS